MQVEGIPDGWELVRVGKPLPREHYIDVNGSVFQASDSMPTALHWHLPVIRKIEKPKRFRHFANAAEFEPHRDRWICHPNVKEKKFRIAAYDDNMIWSNDRGYQYSNLFESGTLFEDGTPFGVEVTE